MRLTDTEQLRLLAGKIANLHWILDSQYDRGASDSELTPLRNKVNKLLGRYQQYREFYDCSAPDYESDDDLWSDFDYCRCSN